jgi:hypothetical protein
MGLKLSTYLSLFLNPFSPKSELSIRNCLNVLKKKMLLRGSEIRIIYVFCAPLKMDVTASFNELFRDGACPFPGGAAYSKASLLVFPAE